MSQLHDRVFKRSFELFENQILTNRYGFNRSDLSVLDLSSTQGPLAYELERRGIRVQRLEQSASLKEPLDLIVCYGPLKEGFQLDELIRTFEPTFQLVLLNVPNLSIGRRADVLNPAEFGKFRRYPIHKWYDFVFGVQTYVRLRQCPVLKIRPINIEFRLRH